MELAKRNAFKIDLFENKVITQRDISLAMKDDVRQNGG
jgi:hypothetical protein